jgi:hypothetical protein
MSTNKKSARTAIPSTAKILWNKSRENPFREGSGAYLRTEAVRKCSGKTRELIERTRSRSIRSTTIPTLARLGLVRAAA